MRISKRPTAPGDLPDLHATASGLTRGSVFAALMQNGNWMALLEVGQKTVLETPQGQSLELVTKATIGVPVTASGTYLHPDDFGQLGEREKPTLRLYRLSDSLRKIGTGTGFVLLLAAVLATMTAAAGVVFLIVGQQQTTVSATADKAQAVLEWVRQPVRQLDDIPAPTGVELEAERRRLDARINQAGRCLQQLQGHQDQAASIPGITCASVTPPWWKTQAAGSLITAAIALITALMGLATLKNRYGFQKNPAPA